MWGIKSEADRQTDGKAKCVTYNVAIEGFARECNNALFFIISRSSNTNKDFLLKWMKDVQVFGFDS